jgi:hypothetical protein
MVPLQDKYSTIEDTCTNKNNLTETKHALIIVDTRITNHVATHMLLPYFI